MLMAGVRYVCNDVCLSFANTYYAILTFCLSLLAVTIVTAQRASDTTTFKQSFLTSLIANGVTASFVFAMAQNACA